MIKLKAKDVYMEDASFSKDLKIKKKTEEANMFELIMDSVCNGGGKHLSKEERVKTNNKINQECQFFKEYMKTIEVKPLKEEKLYG